MSFFGPDAVIDEEKARVYDYQEDRAELESGGSVSAPGVDAQGTIPRVPVGVPLQPLANMWKNANTPATPQELEQKLRAQHAAPPPHMWMPPPPGAGNAGMMPPPPPPGGQFPPMGPFPGGGFMPPMGPPPPAGQGMPPMPVPPHGAFPGMPPPPQSIWGAADGSGNANVGTAPPPPFPGFPNQGPWSYPQVPPPQIAQQQAAMLQQQQQQQMVPPQTQQFQQPPVPMQPHAPTPAQQPAAQSATVASVTSSPAPAPAHSLAQSQAEAHAQAQAQSQTPVQAVPAAKPDSHPEPQPVLQAQSQSESQPPAQTKRQGETKAPRAKSGDGPKQKPYSLTPKNKVTPKSIAEAQNEQQHQPLSDSSNFLNTGGNAGPRRSSRFQPKSEEYYAESEALRPNRRFRHLMTDHDKRHVMEKCVKTMANDDPYVDDYYFHVYTRVHGREGHGREASKYRRVFLKGEGSTSDKLRQQVERAVERAQEYRQRLKEEDRPLRKISASASRPRQAIPLFDSSNTGNGKSRDGSNAGAHSGGAGVLSDALSDNSGAPTSEVSAESTLRSIEVAYDNILALEAHSQRRPAPTDPSAAEWASEGPPLQEKLWGSFQVQKPVDKNNKQPFVEMLMVPKGMKAFARSWPQFDPTKRLTVLTRLVVNIADLVIKSQHFELFGQTVVQPIVHLIGDSDMRTVLLMADLARTKAQELAKSRVGQLLLTAVVSRAEMLSQEGSSADAQQNAAQWASAFGPLFDAIVPVIGSLDVRNDSIWHFFAALALGSDLERQSELVDLVRAQIFAQQTAAKKLSGEAGEQKIVALNLFLNVLGLNATFDDIKELQA